MSRSNHHKPFYVDVGTSIVAVRCASNHDVVLQYDHSWRPSSIELAKTTCDRMNKEAEIGRPRRNCEKYANHNDAMKAFEAFVREQGKLGFINPYTEAFRWLYAPATEKEGGAK